MAGSDKAIQKANNHYALKFLDSKTEDVKGNKKMMGKLLKKAKEQGIQVVKDPEFENSAYLGTDVNRGMRKGINYLQEKGGQYKEIADGILEGFKSEMSPKEIQFMGKDAVLMNLGSGNSAVLAHELGHAQHYEGRGGSIIGKVAHKLHYPSSYVVNVLNNEDLGNGVLAASGFRRGKNSVSTGEDGQIKINHKKALKSAAIGGLISAPLLIAEGAASRQGYKLLKQNGASKELLRAARKDLGNAFGTYASVAMKPVVSELGGHGLGVAYGVAREKYRNHEDNRKL